jgi:hypothetical protein
MESQSGKTHSCPRRVTSTDPKHGPADTIATRVDKIRNSPVPPGVSPIIIHVGLAVRCPASLVTPPTITPRSLVCKGRPPWTLLLIGRPAPHEHRPCFGEVRGRTIPGLPAWIA